MIKHILKKIFSIKNEFTSTTKRKILTILGIKIKFGKKKNIDINELEARINKLEQNNTYQYQTNEL